MEYVARKYLLFDLDGTLTDSKPGICTAVQYALRAFGIEEKDIDKLEPFIGPPLRESFQKFYGFTPEQAEEAVVKYREYYAEKGLFENIPYKGIKQMLRRLQKQGFHIAVASSKPEVYVERILEHFGMRKYFEVVAGATLDGTRDAKIEVIEEAFRRFAEMNGGERIPREQVYMIGDRLHDVNGARLARVECVGVTYGFGSFEELVENHCDYIVFSVKELEQFLMREVYSQAGEEAAQRRREQQRTPVQKQEAPKRTMAQKAMVAGAAGAGNASGAGRTVEDGEAGAAGAGGANGGAATDLAPKIMKAENLPGAVCRGALKRAFTLQDLWSLLLPYFAFVLIRNIVNYATIMMITGIYSQRPDGFAAGLVILNEDGSVGGMTANAALVISALGFIVAAISILPAAVKSIRRLNKTYRLKHLMPENLTNYLFAALCTIGAVLGLNYLLTLSGISSSDEAYQTVSEFQYSGMFVLGLVIYVLITPIAEEILFRGILFTNIRKYVSAGSAICLSSLVFAFYHQNSTQGIYAFFLGCLMAYVYEYFGSFTAACAVHAGANLLSYCLTYTSFGARMTGAWWLCIVSLVVAAASFAMLWHSKKDLLK